MSLQHELIHGHPTRSRRINTALGFPPLSLWLPFACYRTSHLAHHAGDGLTDPRRDPESFYVTGEEWSRMGPVRRMLIHETMHYTVSEGYKSTKAWIRRLLQPQSTAVPAE